MQIELIKKKIKNKLPGPLHIKKYFAILLPLIEIDGETHLIYQIRAEELNTQPGEVSFPGGRVEFGESFCQAAVRETCEELCLDKEQIEILGEIDYLYTPYNFVIYAYVGILKGVKFSEIKANPAEVKKLFTVPVDFLIENPPQKHMTKVMSELGDDFPFHLIKNGIQYKFREGVRPIYFYEYQEQVIWGFTAEMTRNFINILNE